MCGSRAMARFADCKHPCIIASGRVNCWCSARRGSSRAPPNPLMKVIAHISDLHFGAEHPALAAGLVGDVQQLAPTLIIASGDFTQRARRKQFAAARAYLDQ